MFLFPSYADAASRNPELTEGNEDWHDDDRAMFEEAGLDFDQWIDPADLGNYIRHLRAQGAPWNDCAALWNPFFTANPVPVFVARAWAWEDAIRTRTTLRQIRRAYTTQKKG